MQTVLGGANLGPSGRDLFDRLVGGRDGGARAGLGGDVDGIEPQGRRAGVGDIDVDGLCPTGATGDPQSVGSGRAALD